MFISKSTRPGGANSSKQANKKIQVKQPKKNQKVAGDRAQISDDAPQPVKGSRNAKAVVSGLQSWGNAGSSSATPISQPKGSSGPKPKATKKTKKNLGTAGNAGTSKVARSDVGPRAPQYAKGQKASPAGFPFGTFR